MRDIGRACRRRRRGKAGPARAAAAAVLLIASVGLVTSASAETDPEPRRIGIIGTGNVGSALAMHWVAAGYDVKVSSRNPEELVEFAEDLGPRATVGTPREAAAYGEVVFLAVPYAATPQIGRDYADELEGKVVLDAGNPIERRDGEMAREALREGSGIASAEFLPSARVVRAFNTIAAASLHRHAHREPEPIAVPLAGADEQALAIGERLVRDAGFAPVVVGSLETARWFDLGEPLARTDWTEEELRARISQLGLD